MIQCIIMSRPPPPLSKARTMCLPARPSLRSRAADLIGVGLSLACLVHCLALPLLLLAAPALSAWLSLPESFHAVILLLAAPAAALALAAVPADIAGDPAIAQAKSALELAADAPDAGELAALEAATTANPDDHQARFDLAVAQIGAGQRDAAADNLLHIVAADREWNDGAARAKLLSLFEAVGLEDPWVAAQRRRLSLILFG